jgi:hypothetical protein
MHAHACVYDITPPRHGVGSVGTDDELKQAVIRRARKGLLVGVVHALVAQHGVHHAPLVCKQYERQTLACVGSRRGRGCQMIKRQDGR